MKQFLEQGGEIAFVAALAGIGVMVRILLLVFYTVVGRACRNVQTTRNRTIASIREELQRRACDEVRIKSTAVYTECRLAERRVLGIRLGILEEIAEQSVLLVLLGGVLTALVGVLRGGDGQGFLYQLALCGMAALAFLGLDLITGLRERRKRIRLLIRDALENSKAFYERNTEEMLPFAKKERNIEKQEEKRKKREKRREARQKKGKTGVEKKENTRGLGGKQKGKAQEEKRRLTEELLRERRQMEARQLAQRREKEQKRSFMETVEENGKKETETQTMPENRPERMMAAIMPENVAAFYEGEEKIKPDELLQAKEEAAATTLSYASLLHEILAEYLA